MKNNENPKMTSSNFDTFLAPKTSQNGTPKPPKNEHKKQQKKNKKKNEKKSEKSHQKDQF